MHVLALDWQPFLLSGEFPTIFDELRQEYDKEGRDQIVDSLDVATGRMSDGPDVQDTLKYLQHTGPQSTNL